MMTGCRLNSLKEIRDAAQKYIDMGVEIVAVSLGEEGALITDADQTLFAPRLNIEVKSTVGAGDSMVAGLTAGFIGENSLEDTFRMGVACASARCSTESYKLIDKNVYKSLLGQVRIEKI
jgi:fructose-1-phosphate kinase PfkB-like protein